MLLTSKAFFYVFYACRHVVWAGRYGGPGRDGGLDIASTGAGDALLVGASAPAPTLLTLDPGAVSNVSAAAAAAAAAAAQARSEP